MDSNVLAFTIMRGERIGYLTGHDQVASRLQAYILVYLADGLAGPASRQKSRNVSYSGIYCGRDLVMMEMALKTLLYSLIHTAYLN